MKRTALLAALCALAPSLAAAQGDAAAPAPAGVVVTVDVGGGGLAGGGTQYTPSGLFEGELGVGYELPLGLRPELSLALGLAPTTHVALRPGLHYDLPDMPLYARAALDWSNFGETGWRWLLAGGGGAVQLTDVLGAFAEADLGVPLRSALGLGILVRAGVSFRL